MSKYGRLYDIFLVEYVGLEMLHDAFDPQRYAPVSSFPPRLPFRSSQTQAASTMPCRRYRRD